MGTLPDPVLDLLGRLNAPPRLVAHLTLVHAVACMLIVRLALRWPDLPYDGWSIRGRRAVGGVYGARRGPAIARVGCRYAACLVGWAPGVIADVKHSGCPAAADSRYRGRCDGRLLAAMACMW